MCECVREGECVFTSELRDRSSESVCVCDCVDYFMVRCACV